MQESDETVYWSDLSSAEEYYRVHRPYIPVAEQFIIEYYQQVHPSWRMDQDKIPLIVDVGCGSGQLSRPMSKYCERLIGVDISEDQISVARRYNKNQNIEYEVASAFEFSNKCPPHGVDLIVSGMAAHYFDTDEFYDQVKKCLKPGGVLAIVSFWYPGFDHPNSKMKNIIYDLYLDKAIDDNVLRTINVLMNWYRDLYFPMKNATRKETSFIEDVSIDYVKQALNPLHFLFKGGASTTNAFINQLPSETPLRMIFNVFAILSTN